MICRSSWNLKSVSFPAGHLGPLTLFDHSGIHVSLHFAKDSAAVWAHPDSAVVVISTVNTSALPVSDYVFQAAVPKVSQSPLSQDRRTTIEVCVTKYNIAAAYMQLRKTWITLYWLNNQQYMCHTVLVSRQQHFWAEFMTQTSKRLSKDLIQLNYHTNNMSLYDIDTVERWLPPPPLGSTSPFGGGSFIRCQSR